MLLRLGRESRSVCARLVFVSGAGLLGGCATTAVDGAGGSGTTSTVTNTASSTSGTATASGSGTTSGTATSGSSGSTASASSVSVSASASTGTGASRCDDLGFCGNDQTGCMACAYEGPCLPALEACANENDCLDFADCVAACAPGDQPCTSACINAHPTGAPLYIDLGTCVVCDACPHDCNGAAAGCT